MQEGNRGMLETPHQLGPEVGEIKGKAVAPDLVPRFVANLGRSAPFAGVDFGQFQVEQPPAPARYIQFVVGRDVTAGGTQ